MISDAQLASATGLESGYGGLQYRRKRYYDPASGRFTQEDPIGLAGGLNLYGYAGGDPVNHSDPFGLFPLIHLGAGVAKAVQAVKAERDAVTLQQVEKATLGAIEFVHNEILAAGISQAAGSVAGSSLFRSGKSNPGNLRPRTGEQGLSVRTSLSNPIDSRNAPVFPAGGHVTEISSSRLPPGSVHVDNVPAGHAEIRGASAEQVKAAIVNTTKLP